ncbi:glycosyltransferase [Nitrosophilus alvini]|uniref:glycosyltransferase n=1 Tax=Nitrosophilus alvini TaxID=2714855 RepID=UPI001909233B|nr:glycosyltransferase [Nitrosophilus alvini]
MNIFYNHTLELKFSSAQTLQVIKDYCYLSKLGYKIYLYGKFVSIKDLKNINEFIQNYNVHIFVNKMQFWKTFFTTKQKFVITRHHKKLKETLFLKKFVNFKNIHEMHEESFFYIFKPKYSKKYFEKLLNSSDGIIFTNYSQVEFFKKEFGYYPKFKYTVLPNGVEIEKFKNVKMCQNRVLTYTGQFNKWKNVELIFAALKLLPKEYKLRIAGGQSKKDVEYINFLVKKYNLEGRIDYRGFVDNNEIPKILECSNILLVPLGDNVQSKYLTSPMKLFEYMATNIPIVTLNHPSVTNIVKECKNIFLSKNNPKDFAYKIIVATNKKPVKQSDCINKYTYEARSINADNFFKKL